MFSPRTIKDTISNLRAIGRWWQQHPHQVSVLHMLGCMLVLGWLVWQLMGEKDEEISRLHDKIEQYERVLIPQLDRLEPKVNGLEKRIGAMSPCDSTPILQQVKDEYDAQP